MPTNKRSRSAIRNKQNKPSNAQIKPNKKLKLQITPLERSSLKNMYFRLLNTASRSTPSSITINPHISPMDTITIVDINEIKNRPLMADKNIKMVAKIKPVIQDETKKQLPVINSSKDISTTYEKRFFLSYVNLKMIDFEQYEKIGDVTYKIRKKKKVTLNISKNKTKPQKRKIDDDVQIIPEIPEKKTKENIPKAVHTTNKDRRKLLPDSTSRIYHLFIEDTNENKFTDPFEPEETDFPFESVAYKISKKNALKLPSHQWCSSLQRNIVTTKPGHERVIGTFNINGKEKTLYYDECNINKYVSTFSEIIKMTSFDFQRYQLIYSDKDVKTKTDRCITIFKNGDYTISIDGISVKLCAAPVKVKDVYDIEILLKIIDDISLKHELIIV